jgi:phosphoglucosamine mutase
MARLFGTDGVRGIANADLSCELAFKIGQCGARVLTSEVHRPRILIGRDTRLSGEMLQSALVAGICSVGAEAVDVGVVPTPGVAYLTREHDADAGVVISASHNSYEYNGIKWFNAEGYKLPDAVEDRIESMIRGSEPLGELPVGAQLGRPIRAASAHKKYIDFLCGGIQADFSGLKVVLDCANGAASNYAPEVFGRLGAVVHSYFNTPDGCNINDLCGSTHPQRLQQLVVELGADVGLAFDGDADRLLAVDENGVLVDGDRIMAICAMNMKQKGLLKGDTLVATVMSNLGMKNTLRRAGIQVVETAVGDRYVLECMREQGYNLGGEQSGHIIFSDKSTTGDGMLSGLELLKVMTERGCSLSDLARGVEIYPQVLVNVQVSNERKFAYKENAAIMSRIAQAEEQLNGKGRVLVRTSGTEPLIRVMLEGEDEVLIDQQAIAISKTIEQELEGKIR